MNEYVEEVQVKYIMKIDVEEGDVLAVALKTSYISEAGREKLRKEMQDAFLPKVIKVVVINADVVDLKIIQIVENHASQG